MIRLTFDKGPSFQIDDGEVVAAGDDIDPVDIAYAADITRRWARQTTHGPLSDVHGDDIDMMIARNLISILGVGRYELDLSQHQPPESTPGVPH